MPGGCTSGSSRRRTHEPSPTLGASMLPSELHVRSSSIVVTTKAPLDCIKIKVEPGLDGNLRSCCTVAAMFWKPVLKLLGSWNCTCGKFSTSPEWRQLLLTLCRASIGRAINLTMESSATQTHHDVQFSRELVWIPVRDRLAKLPRWISKREWQCEHS